ncbi:MAG: lactonase family protein [Chitinophagaceae bacterium]|nr:lactonase family protein [Chitinophagaceae bacterium]
MNKLFFSCCSLLLSIIGTAQQYTLLVGTYTKGKSEGIYVYDFQPSTADVVLLDSVKTSNPSYLAVSPGNRHVYAVNENGPDNGSGKVSAFAFNKSNRQLTLVNQQSSGGDDPCYITVDKTGKWVIVGNYSSGTLSVLPVAPDGGVGTAVITLQHKGSGPNKLRQQSPHVHATVLSPNNKYLLVTDLGIDKILCYNFNSKKGILTTKSSTKLSDGSGPRHLDFHPSGKWVYVIQELSGTVTTFKYNNGSLQQIQEINLLPQEYTGEGTSADIHVSPDGRFLYASNRNPTNSITIFAIDQISGKLSVVGHQSTLGKVPRNFNFDPTGNFLLVANQETDNIVIFRIDKQTGALADTGKQIHVPNPVCLKWIIINSDRKK